MKILLLGSNGQLGSDILRTNATLSTPMDITAWTRAEIDVANTATIQAVLQEQDFDVLINCTSYHNTELTEKNPDIAFNINAFAVREIASACQKKKATFVHISTDYVFGGTTKREPLTETDSPSPLNVYGASKLMGEGLALSHNDKTIIFRVASLFGVSGASGKGGNFIETILKHAREKGQIKVVSDQHMTPTSTLDIARMLLRLLAKGCTSGTFHAVNTGQATWHELAQKAVSLCKINAIVDPIPATEYPLIAMRPPYSVLDNSKITAALGAIPTWEDALVEYLDAKKYLNL